MNEEEWDGWVGRRIDQKGRRIRKNRTEERSIV